MKPKMKRLTTGEKLIARLRSECGLKLPKDATIKRSYIRDRGKTEGKWVWYIVRPSNVNPYIAGIATGSQFTATSILKCKHKLQVNRGEISILEKIIDIDPCTACQIQMRKN